MGFVQFGCQEAAFGSNQGNIAKRFIGFTHTEENVGVVAKMLVEQLPGQKVRLAGRQVNILAIGVVADLLHHLINKGGGHRKHNLVADSLLRMEGPSTRAVALGQRFEIHVGH